MDNGPIKKMAERVVKGKNVFIAPGAKVIGDIRLGDNVSVWFGAVLRGDIEPIRIGNRSNIQDGCIIHMDPGGPVELGEEVSVGHNAIIHGASIGNNTLIGMGAVLLSGVKVGNNCVVGAHSLLTQGTEIPDNSMVFGHPAKIIRQLTTEEVERNRQNALHYVNNGLRYMGQAAGETAEESKPEPLSSDKRLEALRGKVNLPVEPGQTLTRNLEVQAKIYAESILPLVETVFAALEPIGDFFESFELNCTGEAVGKHADKARIMAELKLFFERTRDRYFNINFNWNNLKKGKQDAFGYYIPFQIELEPQHYHVNRNNNELKTYSKKYDESLSPDEQNAVAQEMLGKVLDYIEKHLQS
jgi:carbonic anhydrase/acetyltransferase-like protein (isoleucine patch superfamily)